jgi:N-dimethylarginine dimethylaminohydrolase
METEETARADRGAPSTEHADADRDGGASELVCSHPAGSLLRQLNCPVLLMNVPLSLSANVPNNAWMEALTAAERVIDRNCAVSQFLELYRHIARTAIVYLLPSAPGLQDQTYVSNLGAVLPHHADTVIVSRFRSAPRVGEERIGIDFFRLMGLRVEQPPEELDGEPAYFEGEADLKHVSGRLYVGAYGFRSSRNVLRWAAERFEMDIVPFRITDPFLYHLDSCMLRITDQTVLLCTAIADPVCLRELERHCEIIDISREQAYAGTTNGLLLSGELLCGSDIRLLDKSNEYYPAERSKIDLLESICLRFDRTLRVFSMSEFYKSGALLSCLIMPIRAGR